MDNLRLHLLKLRGLYPDTCAVAEYRTKSGIRGSFTIPAWRGFDTLDSCWSLFMLADYAREIVPAGCSVWFPLENGEIKTVAQCLAYPLGIDLVYPSEPCRAG